MTSQAPARALISRRAFTQNIEVVRKHTDATLMAIVKANGYGHGVELIAQWAWEAGIDWLGLAQLNEALTLRQSHTHGHVLAWIFAPEQISSVQLNKTLIFLLVPPGLSMKSKRLPAHAGAPLASTSK